MPPTISQLAAKLKKAEASIASLKAELDALKKTQEQQERPAVRGAFTTHSRAKATVKRTPIPTPRRGKRKAGESSDTESESESESERKGDDSSSESESESEEDVAPKRGGGRPTKKTTSTTTPRHVRKAKNQKIGEEVAKRFPMEGSRDGTKMPSQVFYGKVVSNEDGAYLIRYDDGDEERWNNDELYDGVQLARLQRGVGTGSR